MVFLKESMASLKVFSSRLEIEMKGLKGRGRVNVFISLSSLFVFFFIKRRGKGDLRSFIKEASCV